MEIVAAAIDTTSGALVRSLSKCHITPTTNMNINYLRPGEKADALLVRAKSRQGWKASGKYSYRVLFRKKRKAFGNCDGKLYADTGKIKNIQKTFEKYRFYGSIIHRPKRLEE